MYYVGHGRLVKHLMHTLEQLNTQCGGGDLFYLTVLLVAKI